MDDIQSSKRPQNSKETLDLIDSDSRAVFGSSFNAHRIKHFSEPLERLFRRFNPFDLNEIKSDSIYILSFQQFNIIELN